MRFSKNHVTLVGNITQDVSIQTSKMGNEYGKTGIATTEGVKNSSGEWENKTTFHNVMFFGREAVNASKFLKKGQAALIEGKIQYNEYEGKSYTTINAFSFIPFDNKGNSQKKNAPQTDQPKKEMDDIDKELNDVDTEDLPF